MLSLFNTLGKKMEVFEPVNARVVTIFTCGPSIYQRAHIGNFRTFLFEDILVRYLEYLGWRVERGMNITDIEDKAIKQALKSGVTVETLTRENMDGFLREMDLLRIKTPDYLPLASDHVEEAAAMIERLLELKIAYRHGGNVYFDPLKFPGFGKLYGLDMSRWPAGKRRFHRDTYPGTQWNLGDFILWHGYREGDKVLLGYPDRTGEALLEHPGPEHGRQPFSGDPLHLLRRHRQPLPPPRLLLGRPRIAQALPHGPVLAPRPASPRRGQENVQEPRDRLPIPTTCSRKGIPQPRSGFFSSTAITGKSSPFRTGV